MKRNYSCKQNQEPRVGGEGIAMVIRGALPRPQLLLDAAPRCAVREAHATATVFFSEEVIGDVS